MSHDTPNPIKIEVQTAYLEAQSNPQNERYAFSYTITIKNIGESSNRLLTRHWIITDANGKTQEVRGDGVVGEQPLLQPGEGYQYTSGTFLGTPIGTMEGSYGMISQQGETFDAQIPTFSLAVPNSLH